MSGLAALTANYTDSEDEEPRKDEDEEENTRDSLALASNPPSNAPKSATATPNSETSARSTPTVKKTLNLVSYGDIQDDNDDKDAEPVPMDLESDEDKVEADKNQSTEELNRSISVVEVDAWTEGGKLPPEPAGLCSPSIQESVTKAMKKKLEFGYDMNAVIQRKKAFRNPSIYEKLIQFCEIDEHGTNFPKDLYDGHLFGKESYYDELAKVQKLDMERREKASKERSAKLAASTERKEDPSLPKRKSKWDQGPSAQGSSVQPSGIVRPGGAIGKTIPAFGALKK